MKTNQDHSVRRTGTIILVSFFLVFYEASGQNSVALFKDKGDSIAYAQAQAAIVGIFKSTSPADRNKSNAIDSLFDVQRRLRDKIIGYKTVYQPAKDFTGYEELIYGTTKPENITKLSISGVRSNSLPKEVLLCKNLSELELVNTSIKKLPRLTALSKLQKVYVYNNTIASHLKFGKNATITELVIRGVKADNLPGNYKNLRTLEKLDLSKNIGLSSFPNIYRNKKLTKLNLIENIITLEDLKSVSNSSLEDLNLMKNKIEVVPDEIRYFTGLKKLIFNYNQIREIRPGIGKLTQLETLGFYENKITVIPSQIFELENLRSIDLYFNQIQHVSPDISKLKNLNILYLSNNQLIFLPEDMGSLGNLTELYLHNNKLEQLPASFARLQKLRVLRVNNNYLTAFPMPILSLTQLENLDLSKNGLYEFPVKLSDLTKLQILAVSQNPWENRDDLNKTVEVLKARGTVVHGQ